MCQVAPTALAPNLLGCEGMRRFLVTHGRAVALFAVAFPLTLGGALLSPAMVSEAAGCSGGPNLAVGWHWLESTDDGNLPTDGAVLLRGSYRGLDTQAALAAVTVSVTDASIADVPGAVELVELHPPTATAPSDAVIVWRPSAPLSASSSYTATWSVAPGSTGTSELNVSGTVTLTTGAGPGTTTAPSLSPVTATRELYFSGNAVSCNAGSSCGPTVFQDGEAERVHLQFGFTVPASATGQALLFELEESPGKGKLLTPGPTSYFGAITPTNERSVGALFSDDVPEYCVTLVTKDLRDGAPVDSQEVCTAAPTEPPASSPLDTILEHCSESPTAELIPRWCQFHADDAKCQHQLGATDATDDSNGGCACDVTPRRGPTVPALLFAAGLLVAVRRRRR